MCLFLMYDGISLLYMSRRWSIPHPDSSAMKDKSIPGTGFSPHQSPAQKRSGLLRSCCRAARHRPPSGFTSEVARWLLLMPFTFSWRIMSKFSWWCIFLMGEAVPWEQCIPAQAEGLSEEIQKKVKWKGGKKKGFSYRLGWCCSYLTKLW